MFYAKKIRKADLDDFYQSKFEYYRNVSFYSAILAALLEITYFISDCQIFGRFAPEVLIPRFSVIVPILLLILLRNRIRSYRLGAFFYYLLPHAAMWATIWTIWYLPNRDFAREGFIIMHFAFLAVGLAMPVKYHILYHGALLLDIIVSNLWTHYEYFDLMISLAVPLYFGVILMLLFLQNSYADHYLILKQIERESITDQLTGVYNRNKLHDLVMPNGETLHIENAEDIVVLMMDVDKFKEVNDTYGHEAGDRILIMLADTIKKCVRKADVVIRWGGEEFVVFLMGADMDAGVRIAEEIRRTIEELPDEVCPVTVSVGVSKYVKGTSYRETVRNADKALYYAKEHGRNRVITEDQL